MTAYTTWTISRDHLYERGVKEWGEKYAEDERNDKGVTRSTEPRLGWIGKEKITKDTPGARKFYLRDDDGILYYEGWFKTYGDTDGWDDIFNWGAWYAGTTAVYDGRRRLVIG